MNSLALGGCVCFLYPYRNSAVRVLSSATEKGGTKTKKIAILTCLNAAGSCCTGASCLAAFQNRSGAFQSYQGEELQLTAFFHCNGCQPEQSLEEKTDRILHIRPDAVHLGVCTLKKDGSRCPKIQAMAGVFRDAGIPVINGTHGSPRLENIGEPIP